MNSRRFLFSAATMIAAGLAHAIVMADIAPASTGADMGDLAKKLANPTASLISVPLQGNIDWGGGPNDDGMQFKLNVQPVVPIDLNPEWKLLTRYVVPYVYQEDRIGTGSQSGLADSTATFWVSPAADKPGAPIWGIGPVFQLPTATDDLLGAEKWCFGPSAIVLKQENGYTYGFLANQLWSFAGHDDRADVSYLFVQPFFTYTTPKHTTYGVNSESVYDWKSSEWTVPINLFVTQLVKIHGKPVSLQAGVRYYLDKPDGGPDWGIRFGVTLVFPK
jgi:hypothetical protein